MATPIPDNCCSFTVAELVAATSGQVRLGACRSVRGIATDSRKNLEGKLFVALKGERFDAHRFVGDAVRAGATALLVSSDDVSAPANVTVLRVPCTLTALGALGRAQRRRWGGRLVAVGGSAGKTTTKTAVAAALEAHDPGRVHAVSGNLNNRIGVPMVLLGLLPEQRAAVVEIGTNTRGEVRKLAAVCEPDLAILTLIALEHAAGIGDIAEIEAEEGELFEALGASETALANGDDERCRRQLERCSAGTKQSYGVNAACDYRIMTRSPLGVRRALVRIARPAAPPISLETSLIGQAGALAVAAAVAVVERLLGRSLDATLLATALGQATLGDAGRLRPIELRDGSVVLDDTYNANPASVKASLAAAQELATERGARLVLVVGEMLELGECSIEAHRELGRELARSGAAALIAVAGDAALFLEPARAGGLCAKFASDSEAALGLLLSEIRPGDLVLVKASRGVRAESVVEGLIRAKGEAA